MERREDTSLPRSNYNDSGVEINTLLSSASQFAPDEDPHIDLPHDVDVEANGVPHDAGEIQDNAVLVLAVQESQDTEGDVDLHPAYSVIFRAVRDQIISLCQGDVDLHAAKAQLLRFRQLLLEVEICWTCFGDRRGVINIPCMCFCNCLECAEVTFLCSLCGRRIDHAVPAVFQYVAEE